MLCKSHIYRTTTYNQEEKTGELFLLKASNKKNKGQEILNEKNLIKSVSLQEIFPWNERLILPARMSETAQEMVSQIPYKID